MAADLAPILATVEAALRTIPGVTVYDGYVPSELPTDASGYVLPYIVIWFGVGQNPAELPLSGLHGTDSLVLDFQTTTVGSTPAICRAVTGPAKTALTNLRAGTGVIRPNPDSFNQQSPILDSNISPARFYLPSQWRLHTN